MLRPALICALLSVVATWPFVADPAGGLLGHPGNDVWNHVWGYWWVAQELEAGRLPYYTDLMNFPRPGRLFFIDTFGAILTLPVQWLGGPVLAYNTAVFLSFWASGLCAWLLTRHVVRAVEGEHQDHVSYIAAIGYIFAPHLLAQAYNGITETLNAFGLPLAMLAVMRLYERPTPRRAVEAALAGAFAMLANWYFGFFAALGAVLWLLSQAFWRRDRIHWAALPLPVLLAGGGGLLLVGPALLGFASTLGGEGAMVSRDREFVWKQLITHNVTDFVSFFHPGKFYSPDLKALHGEDLLIVTYLGWTLLLLAGLGLARLRRWRDSAPWLLWLVVYVVMTLGPYLYVNGEHVLVDGRRIPLPFLAFFDALPVFERISHPFRFVMGVQLALGVLAALGLARLPRWGQGLAAVVLGLELLLGSPAVWPLPRASAEIPAIYTEIKADPVPGAVLDLPVSVPNLERASYLYYQTLHGRPSPYGLNEPLPEVLGRSRLLRTLLLAEAGRMDRLPPMMPELDLVVSGRSLARLGFRYVVLHGDLYPPERRQQSVDILRVALGPETAVRDSMLLWRLESPEKETAPAQPDKAP